MDRLFRLARLLLLAAVLHPATAWAQAWPTQPIHLIVPFPPGGPTDVVGRILAPKLSELWGQQVVIENRAGASGNIGSALLAKAAPDGYTLAIHASSHAISAQLYSNLSYDPIADFTPITQIVDYKLVFVVHPSMPVQTFPELIAYVKANPGKVSYASTGSGAPTHLCTEMLRQRAGLDMVHVPYKGAADATNDLLGGHVNMMCNNPVSAMPHVRGGKLRALAVAAPEPIAQAPGVPTVASFGFPGFEAGTWYGFFGPAKLPRAIVDKVHLDVVKVLAMPDVRERIVAQGFDVIGTTPERMGEIMRDDIARWGAVIKAGSIKAE